MIADTKLQPSQLVKLAALINDLAATVHDLAGFVNAMPPIPDRGIEAFRQQTLRRARRLMDEWKAVAANT